VPPLRGGHSLCQGCGIPVVVRTVLGTIQSPAVVVNATGCLEVATTRYPTTAWNVPWLHVAFENAAAVASGVESAQRALRRRHALRPGEEVAVVVFAGDGGTHHVPYVAQAAAVHWHDLSRKVERAVAARGPAFLNVLTDCPLGWGHEPRLSAQVLNAAVESRFWPLYEVVDGRYRLTYEPERPVPIETWLGLQQRFAHLVTDGNRQLVDEIQEQVDAEWNALLDRCADDGTS